MIRTAIVAGLVALAAATPADARWREASSEHFVIYSEQSPQQLRAAATRLEQFDKGLRQIVRIQPHDGGRVNRLTVYLLSAQRLRQLLNGSRRSSVAGFYIGRAGNAAAYVTEGSGGSDFNLSGQTILFHEYTHHLMLQNSSTPPPRWYSEGFAEFAATTKFARDGSVEFGQIAKHRAYGLLLGPQLTVEGLIARETAGLGGVEADAFYGRGWLLTHYLTFADARRGQLDRYLMLVASGRPGIDAARDAFGDLETLDSDLADYMRRKPYFLRLPATQLAVEPVAVRELSDGEDAILPVRIRSKRGVNREQALAILPQARKIAALYPNDAAVQVALAEAEYDCRHLAQADGAADRAIAIAPKHVRAMVYKSMVALARHRAGIGGPDTVRDARSWAVRANRIEPDDPLPLLYFYRSFSDAGEPPSASAVTGLARALALSPQDTQVRFLLIRQRLNDGDLGDARRLLEPVAYAPHGGAAAGIAVDIIRRIDAGERRGLAAHLSPRHKGDDEGEGDDDR